MRCLYTPPRLPIELVEVAATDPDRIGGPRTLNVAIRFSRMAPQPLPIVSAGARHAESASPR